MFGHHISYICIKMVKISSYYNHLIYYRSEEKVQAKRILIKGLSSGNMFGGKLRAKLGF
ncbi:hypothetical protein X975_13297, partial [Stegodyphus mimosarum]